MKRNNNRELCIIDGFEMDIIKKNNTTYLHGYSQMGRIRYEKFSISLETLKLKELRTCLHCFYTDNGTKTFTSTGSMEISGVYVGGTRYINSRHGKAEIMVHQCANKNVMVIAVTDDKTNKTMSLSISSDNWDAHLGKLVRKLALIDC